MVVTIVTGSSYSCNNGNHGSGDDDGCGDCDGDTNHGSGGDGNTNGCSGCPKLVAGIEEHCPVSLLG